MEERPDRALIEPRSTRGLASAVRRRLVRSDFSYGFLASIVANYLRFVRATSRVIVEPESPAEMFDRYGPLIATTWHAEAFLLPVMRPPACPVDVMVSRARDGEMISRSLNKLGCGTVRGSGATDRTRIFEKGAVTAFRGLLAALDRQHNVLLTADFDRSTHGKVSPGIIALARLSQRPVVPLVAVTSNRRRARSWDHTALNLPFSRMVFVHADPVLVPRRASESECEDKRLEVERALNAITERAYAIADRRDG